MSEQSERKERGLIIAAKSKITQQGNTWKVPSQSGYAPYYFVNPDPNALHCTCPDFEKREAKCKHIYAVEIVIERETSTTTTTDVNGNETTTTTEVVVVTKKVTYGQDWEAYNKAQTQEKAIFQKLLADLCGHIVEPPQPVKGGLRLSYQDMLFAIVFKVYSTVSGRRIIKQDFNSFDLSEIRAAAGAMGGAVKSERKTAAARANLDGKRTGRKRLPEDQLSPSARSQRKRREAERLAKMDNSDGLK